MLRRIFGSKRDEITGEWRKLLNEELYDLYCSRNIIRVIKSRRMRWTGHVACMGERRGVYSVLVGKREGKRPLGRPGHSYYYYRYSALGPVWAETRAQSVDWYSSGTLHPGQVFRGSLPLLVPAFRRSHFRHQVPQRRERS